jgi:nucleotide-binding universal stress UspA family protein
MIAISNVLVATDFSTGADVALEYGRAFARTFGARLHVMHVVEDVTMQLVMIGASGPLAPIEIQRDLEAAARTKLEASVREDDRRELRAVPVVRTGSNAAQAIVSYAGHADIDLIILGTHGRGGVAHLLLGSVAERVVRTAPCPVLTVRDPEREFLKPDALQRTESEPAPSGSTRRKDRRG